jgi:23S rRNA (guanosine2251-2'-O)-methyltransferase
MREILYGRQPVRETLLAQRRQVFGLKLAKGVRTSGILSEITALAKRAKVPVEIIDRRDLDRYSGEANHQGLAAEVSGYPYAYLEDILPADSGPSETPVFLLLDHIKDPQNLGSLLRTADATGVRGVVVASRRAAGVTPAVVRASAGAAEHVRVAQVSNVVQAMVTLKKHGIWLAGLEAGTETQLYSQADLKGSLGLVVGSEGQGLGRLVKETCDFLIRLPMQGQVASLNAAVAGAVALYEAQRQRTSA